MNVKSRLPLIILVVGIALIIAGVSAAVVLWTTSHPSTANIPENADFLLRLDGNTFTDNTPIAFGDVSGGGTFQKVLYVENTGNVAFTVHVATTGLPAGWTETYAQEGTTIVPGQSTTGNLVLTVPAGEGPIDAEWTTTITGESVP